MNAEEIRDMVDRVDSFTEGHSNEIVVVGYIAQAIFEVAAQLSELKAVIRNANLRHEQKDI